MSCSVYGDNSPLMSRDKCRLMLSDEKGYFSLAMKTFRDALLETLNITGVSLKSVAEGTGVSYEQLKKLKQTKSRSTNVEDARKIAAYFGKSLDAFIDGTLDQEDIEIASLLSKLDPASRTFLINAARAQISEQEKAQEEPPAKSD